MGEVETFWAKIEEIHSGEIFMSQPFKKIFEFFPRKYYTSW